MELGLHCCWSQRRGLEVAYDSGAGSYRQLPAVTGSYRQLPADTGSYRQLPAFTSYDIIILSVTLIGSYQQLPAVTGSYRQLPAVTGSYLHFQRLTSPERRGVRGTNKVKNILSLTLRSS